MESVRRTAILRYSGKRAEANSDEKAICVNEANLDEKAICVNETNSDENGKYRAQIRKDGKNGIINFKTCIWGSCL